MFRVSDVIYCGRWIHTVPREGSPALPGQRPVTGAEMSIRSLADDGGACVAKKQILSNCTFYF